MDLQTFPLPAHQLSCHLSVSNLPQITTHQSTSAFDTAAPDLDAPVGSASSVVSKANDAIATVKPVKAVPRARVGRNAPCPCGTGQKYKSYCGT